MNRAGTRAGGIAWVAVGVLAVVGACARDAPRFPEDITARAAAAAMTVDEARLRLDVQSIVDAHRAEVPVVSAWSEQAAITRVNAAAYLTTQLRAAGLSPVVEKVDAGGVEATNVYADIRGETSELVLVTGHLDAWFQSGADDDGSAMAVILETARLLARERLRRTVRFVAFDREEEGLLGSRRYFEAHAGEAVRIVLNMDCVGFASSAPGSQDAPTGLSFRDTGDFLAAISDEPTRDDLYRLVGLGSGKAWAPEVLGLVAPGDARYPAVSAFLRSDHALFWLNGIRAVFLTDTADYRNPNYHSPRDTPDTLDYAFLGRVARFVAAAAFAFAEGP